MRIAMMWLNVCLTRWWQPVGSLNAQMFAKSQKITKCSPSVESMGCDHSLESSWNEDCNDVTFVCLTCCWQPIGNLNTQMFAKSQKNTKCSPLVESMGCDHSLESSWNEDCNDVTFECLTCCWQPVGSLSKQMFAKSQKYKMFTKWVVTTHWNRLERTRWVRAMKFCVIAEYSQRDWAFPESTPTEIERTRQVRLASFSVLAEYAQWRNFHCNLVIGRPRPKIF